MNGARGLSVGLIVAGQSVQSLSVGAIALFLPLIRSDLGISLSQAGAVGAVALATYAIMQLPAGYLADRFPPKQLFLIGLVGLNVLTLTLSFIDSYEVLLANQAVSGVFRSLLFTPGLMLITSQFPTDRRATAMGLYVAGGFSSNVLVSSIGPLLVVPLGWRGLLLVFAGLTTFIVLGFWRAVPHIQREQDADPQRFWAAVRFLVVQRIIWSVALVQFVRLALLTTTTFWMPTFLVSARGLELPVAGAIVAAGALVSIPANLLGGYLSDRLNAPRLVIAGSLAVLGLTMILLVGTTWLPAIVAVVLVQSLFLQVYFGPLFAYPISLLGAGSSGVISGLGNTFANLGALAGTLMLGITADLTGGFDLGFYVLTGLAAAALITTLFWSRPAGLAVETGSP